MRATTSTSATRRDDLSRQRRWLATLFVTGLCVAVAAGMDLHPVKAQQVSVVDVVRVAEGYRASRLIGKSVINGQNQTIGKLEDLIIDQDKIPYAILEVGGFLGLGAHMVAVAFGDLSITDNGHKIVLTTGGTKEDLQKAPAFNYGQHQK